MTPTANPEMLVVARESRGLTQKELADRLSISQANVSKFESGILSVSDELLEQIATALGYPKAFFRQYDQVYGYGSSCLYHRKRQSLPAHQLRRIIAELNVLRMQVSRLLRGVEVETESRFYRMDLGDYENCPELIAQLVRKSWNLPSGPVQNLTRTIESCGGIVVRWSFGTNKIDAVSQWVPNMPPLFFVNSEVPGDRLRYTLAHEVGHLIMHHVPTPNLENEADRFAAEFMMPSADIASQLSPLPLQKLAHLKPYWMVSMAALARRAFDLGRITQRHYRTLFTQMSKMGIRKHEPVPIPPEEPTVLADIIDIHRKQHGYTNSELIRLVNSFDEDLFRSKYLPDNSHLKLVR
jgi:Zn-dependent peptidase ImmA (M78 family)/DNA-binding XRE family transcriptional regulator